MTACMGGWCRIRDKCPHYSLSSRDLAERMCLPGRDGYMLEIPRPTDESVERTLRVVALFPEVS